MTREIKTDTVPAKQAAEFVMMAKEVVVRARKQDADKRYARVKVSPRRGVKATTLEPLVAQLQEIQERHGVSDYRIRKFFGFGRDRLLKWRRENHRWKHLQELRAVLWAMGYEIRVVRKCAPLRDLVVTEREYALGIGKIQKKYQWIKRAMWGEGDGGIRVDRRDFEEVEADAQRRVDEFFEGGNAADD